MNTNNNLLIGKWKFIAAEKHDGNQWQPTSYTESMIWDFHPEYISTDKSIGTIVESALLVESVSLNYIYDSNAKRLKIEVYTDPKTRILDEIDIYDMVADAENKTIQIELINQRFESRPYLRYTLQQM